MVEWGRRPSDKFTNDPSMTTRSKRHFSIQMMAFGIAALLKPALALTAAEEQLTDAMRSLLRHRLAEAVAAPVLPEQARHWQSAIETPLIPWIAQLALRNEFSQHLWYEAQRAGLSLSLVLGLVEVESGFRKHAISSAGAMGYAQVMPFWTRLIGDGDASTLLSTQPNLRYACLILRHYLDLERGDLTLALGRYNGSRGLPHYPERVLQARAKWRTEVD
jgi:soluble lytic murein transglycosylase-like protein